MDVVERLTLEAAQADTMIAREHRHRYELAAELCRGLRVVDLCCGSGYGSAILAPQAARVVGVDVDVATVETASVTVGREAENVAFEAAEAIAYLRRLPAQVEAVVCFEGLEHLEGLDEALDLLARRAETGLRIVASVPNDRLFDAVNPYHVTTFGYDEARRAFARFPQVVMVPQFLAEGSLIVPLGASEAEVQVELGDRHEPEYANHFIFCVNFEPALVERVHRGRIQLSTSPVFNRWSEDLKRGAWALRRENARLARSRLGKADAAAASALARLAVREGRVAELEARAARAEARVRELEARLGGDGAEAAATPETVHPGDGDGRVLAAVGRVEVIDAKPRALGPGQDPNSWEQRSARAAEVLIPWIEQTVPLAGKTVLEYGCGNGAVSAAFAARAGRVIGVDIDAAAVQEGRAELASRGVANAQLHHHPVPDVVAAVRRHRGEVDVFLLYAVLEHLTPRERLEVLELAREVVKPSGAIVVCETPNRLVYLDHHTARMPFFHLIPDELAARYYARSEREDFRAAMAAAADRGEDALLEAVARWGRGVGFQEFEVVFGDLADRVLASSYDPALFGERPIHPEEVVLARYLDRVRPDLAPAWSRQWLDVILSPAPVGHRPAWIRPWTAETIAGEGVGWTRWENLRLRGPEAWLPVRLPAPTGRLLVATVADDGEPLAVEVLPEGQPFPLTAQLRVAPPYTGLASFSFATPVQAVTVRTSARCHIVFIGYET